LRRFHEATMNNSETVTMWGTGSPKREFLHSDDMADACIHVMMNYDGNEIINIGCGEDLTIKEAAEMIAKVVGFKGRLEWDSSKPDGTPRKLLDISRIKALGWSPNISLFEGLQKTYVEMKKEIAEGRWKTEPRS
jgi:GDP-L-fucose synthase